MTVRRAGAGVMAAVGVGFLVMAAAPAARAQVKLEYKFPEGRITTYKTVVKMGQTLTIGGMEIETNIDQTLMLSSTVGKRGTDQTLPVREKVDGLRVEIGLPGGQQFTFDSKDPDAKIDNPQLESVAEIFKLVGAMDYTVVLDGKNKVKAVEGAEKLEEKTEKLNPQFRDAMRGRFSADKLKQEFEQHHGDLPDVLARPGEPWERTLTMDSNGQEVVVRKKYEYAGTEKKGDKTFDKISVKTLEMKMKENPNQQGPAKMTKADLKVDSSDGTILFDREAGRVVESRDKIHVKGTMTLMVGEMELATDLDQTIETTTELQPSAS